MKSIILFCIFFASLSVSAQILDPVKWTFSTSKIAEQTYEVRLTASVKSPWAVYSQHTPEGGPLPTTISFNKNPIVTLKDNAKEIGKLYKKQDQTFDVQVHYYKDKVDFVQIVKLKSNVKTELTGTIEFMACDDERCLPPKTIPFKVYLK